MPIRIRGGRGSAVGLAQGGGGGSDTLVATLDLENFDSSDSNTTREFGHIFQDGDIPGTSIPVLKNSGGTEFAHAMRDPSFYVSGCYKHAFFQVRGTAPSSSTLEVNIWERPSTSYSDTPNGSDLSDVIAAIDMPSIEFSSVTAKYRRVILCNSGVTTAHFDDFIGTGYTVTLIEGSDVPLVLTTDYTITNGSGTTYDGTTGYDGITVNLTSNPSGMYVEIELSWTHAGGSVSTDLSDANVSGRITTPVDTALFKRFCTWSMATDRQLRVDWEVDVWFASNGDIETVYCVGMPALTWFDEPNKTLLQYTAVFKKASTTLATYSSVMHSYTSAWGTFRTDSSNWAGMAYCFLGTSHSVNPVYDRVYWEAADCFPSFSTTHTPDELTSGNSYVARSNLGHRANIDDGGTYAGRGTFPSFDTHCHMLQTPASHRTRRVNALAGLHIAYRVRSGDPDTDAPIRCLTLPLDKPGAAADKNAYVADGMPVARYFNRDGRNDIEASDYSSEHQPSDGIWAPGGDASHLPNFSGYSWLIDGHEYLKQAMLDHMTHIVGQVPRDRYGSRPKTAFYDRSEWRTAFSIPDRQWESIPQLGGGVQVRSIGWSLNILAMLGFIAPGTPEYNFAQDWIAHCGDYMGDSLAAMPSDFLAIGLWPSYDSVSNAERVTLPWQHVYVAIGAEFFAKTTEDAGGIAMATHMSRGMKNLLGDNPMKASAYYAPIYHKTLPYDASTNPFPDPADIAIFLPGVPTRSGDTFTTSRLYGGDGQPILRMADGDGLLVAREAAFGDSPDTSFVTPLAEGTIYLARDVSVGSSTITFKVEASSGSGAISLSGDTSQRFMLIPRGGQDDAYLDGNGNPLTAEDYAVQAVFAAAQHRKRDDTICTDAIVAQGQAYCALVDYDGDARWKAERV